MNLLAPLSGKAPCGESLRYTEIYDHIREARREENEKLPQGVWKIDVKRADWEKVSQLCQDALLSKTKDLQIAAWLAEAWLHLEGMPGLRKGLQLIFDLTQIFWKDIHPQLAKENAELRMIPYDWMNTKLAEALMTIKISAPSQKSILAYCFLDYQEAHRLDSPTTQIDLSITHTPTAFYRRMQEDSKQTLEIIHELEEWLHAHIKDGPSFHRLREQLHTLQRFSHHILANQEGKMREEQQDTDKEKEVMESQTSQTPLSPSIQSREHAYLLLTEVESYLKETEPHSPTPYLIQRAIAWGDMSLPQVVADTLHNGQDMSLLLDLLNIKREP